MTSNEVSFRSGATSQSLSILLVGRLSADQAVTEMAASADRFPYFPVNGKRRPRVCRQAQRTLAFHPHLPVLSLLHAAQ